MEKNNVRYELDFRLMPLMTENKGIEFINLIIVSRGSIICTIFNSFYDECGNSTFFKDNPKHFTEDQFVFTEKDFSNNLKIVHISLPEEHEGSDIYCTAYIFACHMEDNIATSCSMYTVEKSMGDMAFIGKMTDTGHLNFGISTDSADGDIERIREIVTSR
ncbi:MAG: hypothetical protein K2J36_09040 [Ruminococcus sp.]|nr:hypothetical protein [Ruminococcus sp.]MDE6798140.1 hypothetical protein [Ruminococcus sp.]